MVQVLWTDRFSLLRQWDCQKSFWKLSCNAHLTKSELWASPRDAGRPVKSSTPKEELLQKQIRGQRGLLNYDQCSVAELRAFCVARGLVSSQEAKRLRVSNLILKLNEADDGETFNHFLDLPAELRVYIYELYLRDFDTDTKPLDAPYPIPLAEVCTVVRREFLPLYCGFCTFQFDVDHASSIYRPKRNYTRSGRASIWQFIVEGPSWQVAVLRKFSMSAQIEYLWDRTRDHRGNSYVYAKLDLGTDDRPAKLQIHDEDSWEQAEGEFDVIMPLVHNILRTTDTRAGGKKLLRSDAEAIFDIFDEPPEILKRPLRLWDFDDSD
ncbi:hypothetical protein CBER1_10514 [Cercospora berteroae]|uniref:Uncharacterized protein n=1 Tax=Cercospora berteroae TaxID=357750 RepID=A0A2S6BXN1_9PEZI|nr:hypothetical protein CBER1_10514 [Cercospora berteroae]